MIRITLKDGRVFFAAHKEKQGQVFHFAFCSEAFPVWEHDDEGMLVKKVYRRAIGDRAYDRKEVRAIEYHDSHYLPLFEPDFTGLAAEINKDDAAHERQMGAR